MAKLIKRGNIWYSDLRMGKKRIRRALSTDKRFAEEKLADLIKLRQAQKHGDVPQDLSWELFRAKYMVYSRGAKTANTNFWDDLSFRYLEKFYPIRKISDI